ncbi:MAG: hypothetical protein VX313_03470, partial [Bacteroidota bacterium]|nr:hypothetical protein [Bacteroidota bacterium]
MRNPRRKLLDAFQMQLALVDLVMSLAGPMCVIAFRLVIIDDSIRGSQLLTCSLVMAVINITMEDLVTILIAVFRTINVGYVEQMKCFELPYYFDIKAGVYFYLWLIEKAK